METKGDDGKADARLIGAKGGHVSDVVKGEREGQLTGWPGSTSGFIPAHVLAFILSPLFLRNYHNPFNLIVLKSNSLFQDNEEIIYSAFHTYSLFEYESEITRDLIYYIVHNVNGSSVIDVSMIVCGVSRLCADNDNEVETRACPRISSCRIKTCRTDVVPEKQTDSSVRFVWEQRVAGGKVWKWNWKQSATARKPCSPLAAAHLDS